MTKLTLNDVRNYLIKIQVNFENAYKFETSTEDKLLLVSWMDVLSKYPKELCDTAVNNVLARAKFAPRLGDITEEITKIIQLKDSKTDIELWAELMEIKREVFDTSLYLRYPQHYDEAMKKLNGIYANLSDDLKLYIVNLFSLIDICSLTEESLQYEKTQFFRKMPELRKHSADKASATKLLELLDKQLLSFNDKKDKKDNKKKTGQ